MNKKRPDVFNPKLENPNKPKSESNIEKVNDLLDSAKSYINKDTEKNILKSINSKEFTEISIEILKPSLLRKILNRKSKKFYIKALSMFQSTKIAEILLDLPDIKIDEKTENSELFNTSLLHTTQENVLKLCDLISVFLIGEVDKKTSTFLYHNLTFSEVLIFVSDVIKNGGYMDFIYTILLTQNNLKLKTAVK